MRVEATQEIDWGNRFRSELNGRLTMKETVQKDAVALAFAVFIDDGAPGQDGEPTPEGVFRFDRPHMPDGPQQGSRHRPASRFLVPSGQDEGVAKEPIK